MGVVVVVVVADAMVLGRRKVAADEPERAEGSFRWMRGSSQTGRFRLSFRRGTAGQRRFQSPRRTSGCHA